MGASFFEIVFVNVFVFSLVFSLVGILYRFMMSIFFAYMFCEHTLSSWLTFLFSS